MIVYFSASAHRIKKDITVYRRILNVIRARGHIVVYDWTETAFLRATKPGGKDGVLGVDWPIVKEIEGAIEGADLVIAEASDVSTFGVGYEVSRAIQRGKPILILVRNGVADLSYAAGVRNDLVTQARYDNDALEEIVEHFIDDNTVNTKDLRFNFVIDRQIHNHLRWKSYKTGKTKAEVVRDLLLKDMDKRETK